MLTHAASLFSTNPLPIFFAVSSLGAVTYAMLCVPGLYSVLLSILLRVESWQAGVEVAEMKLDNGVESVDRRQSLEHSRGLLIMIEYWPRQEL
jgi:hypothetical protein